MLKTLPNRYYRTVLLAYHWEDACNDALPDNQKRLEPCTYVLDLCNVGDYQENYSIRDGERGVQLYLKDGREAFLRQDFEEFHNMISEFRKSITGIFQN